MESLRIHYQQLFERQRANFLVGHWTTDLKRHWPNFSMWNSTNSALWDLEPCISPIGRLVKPLLVLYLEPYYVLWVNFTQINSSSLLSTHICTYKKLELLHS